jgi:cell division septation protein DedD
MKQSALLLVLLCAATGFVCAQGTEPDIAKYVAAVTSGNADDVRRELPGLVTKYPNHPGVLYLQGLVTREGSEAIRTYQSIVDNFPESEWADDALYRVYQFYYALGLYRTAEIKMKQLAERYPASPYVKIAATAKTPEMEAANDRPAAETTAVAIPPAVTAPGTAPVPVMRDTAMAVRFALQVGAFGLQSNAQTLRERFEASGYTVEMISKVRDTRSLFLVWVGSYGTYEEARTAGQDVKRKMGVDPIVVSR